MSAYLDTRVSLFADRLWPDPAFEALLEAPEATMAALLAAHGLRQMIDGDESPARRTDAASLERRIVGQVLEETRVLIRPLRGEARAFLAFWTARFELSNVKALLRSKMRGERPAAALARMTPMGAFGRLDVQSLVHAEDVGELLRRLQNGPYAGIVRHARLAFEQTPDPFVLDAALDHGYYEGLAQRAQALEDGRTGALHGLMAQLIDRINLVWLLRYRFNYGLPPSQVYYLLVGSHYTLASARLRELAALDSLAAVLDALPPPWHARLAGATNIPAVFARMEHAAAQHALHVLRSRAPALARAFAYLTLRERDLRAVRAVLRGRHLGLAPADIRLALQRGTLETM